MCPCPICTAILIILSPLLILKKSRNWLKNKIMGHHKACQVCQQAEHEVHMKDHTPCHCVACEKADAVLSLKKKSPTKGKVVVTRKSVQKGVKKSNTAPKKETVKNIAKKQS